MMIIRSKTGTKKTVVPTLNSLFNIMTDKHYIKREIQDMVAEHLEQKEMTVILGARQVGKTVLLEQLRNWLWKHKKINPDFIFYYNLDIINDWEIVRDQTKFIEFLKSRSVKQISRKRIFGRQKKNILSISIFF